MNQDDFKKLLDEALKPIHKQLERLDGIERQLNDSETGLVALNRKMNINTAAIMELEATIKVYADMYHQNNNNVKRLERRIEVLEDNSGIIPPPEYTLVDVA